MLRPTDIQIFIFLTILSTFKVVTSWCNFVPSSSICNNCAGNEVDHDEY